MQPQIAAFIVSLNIGLFLPVMYANGAACYPGWILFGPIIRRGMLLFNCISHVEIEYRIQPEKFRLQASRCFRWDIMSHHF